MTRSWLLKKLDETLAHYIKFLYLYALSFTETLRTVFAPEYSIGFRIGRPILWLHQAAFQYSIVLFLIPGLMTHLSVVYCVMMFLGFCINQCFGQIGILIGTIARLQSVKTGYLDVFTAMHLPPICGSRLYAKF